jgi:hypothetical protein
MPNMRMRTDESPPRHEDPATDPMTRGHDDVRNIETAAGESVAISDSLDAWTDDPDINTHGSER